MSARGRAAVIALLAAGVAASPAGCERVHVVTLEFTAVPNTVPTGFTCHDDAGLLVRRLDTGGTLNLVVDFLDLRGRAPGCLPAELIVYCMGAGQCCPPVARARGVVSLSVAPREDLRDVLRAAQAQVARTGIPWVRDAPTGAVLVRVVGTVQPREALVARPDGTLPEFDPDALIGCVRSCPVALESTDSVGLELVPPGTSCDAAAVAACAGVGPAALGQVTCGGP